MSAIIGLVMKFFSDVFIGIGNEQLSTLGETYEIQDEQGTIELDSKIDDILDEYRDL